MNRPTHANGTKVVRGPLRRIELGSVDAKNIVHKRIRWCAHSDRIAKALIDSLKFTDTKSHLRKRRRSFGNLLILEVVKRDLLEDYNVSDYQNKYS